MAFNLQDAISKIGTAEYSGVDGLIRLVNETSAIADNAADNATTLLYGGVVDKAGTPAWKLINAMAGDFVNTDGLKQVVTLADTPVSGLLNDDAFKDALLAAVGGDETQYDLIIDGKPDKVRL